MVRIAVISDTHGSVDAVEKAIAAAGDVDCWFHLGDFASDAKHISKKTGLPVYSVLGNCDGWVLAGASQSVSYPEPQRTSASEMVVTVGKARIMLCHGHTYDVDFDTLRLGYRAEELECDAVLYGHTHVSEFSAYGRVMKLNPGSPSRPRGGRKPSFAIMTVDEARVNADIVLL
ncbi:MAG: metallophosphoesterase [Clostridia bacterium]|nr:metallophosphoesterase [Clostridia bacterium]